VESSFWRKTYFAKKQAKERKPMEPVPENVIKEEPKMEEPLVKESEAKAQASATQAPLAPSSEQKKTEEEKPAEKTKEKAKKPPKRQDEFIPVIYQGEKTEVPISVVKNAELTPPAEMERNYFGYVGISRREENEQVNYYLRPANFQKYVLEKNITLEDAQRVRREVLNHLNDLKRAWVKLGTAVISVHIPRLYLAWGFKTFEQYCEQELKLNYSTVYQIMNSTLFLMRDKPEIYRSLMAGDRESYVPSYLSLYLLKKKRKRLEEKGKFTELLEMVVSQGLSTRELQRKLKEVLGEKRKKLSLKGVIKSYFSLCKAMQKLKIAEEVVKEAEGVLEKLKRMEA
jgi:hypothetical protein